MIELNTINPNVNSFVHSRRAVSSISCIYLDIYIYIDIVLSYT